MALWLARALNVKKHFLTVSLKRSIGLCSSRGEGEQSGDRYRNALAPAWFWTAVLDILRYTAIRQNQFLHIRISDVDFDSHCIHLRLEGG